MARRRKHKKVHRRRKHAKKRHHRKGRKLSKKSRMRKMRAGLRKYWKDVKAGKRRAPRRRRHRR